MLMAEGSMIRQGWARAMLVTSALAHYACGNATSDPALGAGGASGGVAADDGGNPVSTTGGSDAGGGEPMSHGIPLGRPVRKKARRAVSAGAGACRSRSFARKASSCPYRRVETSACCNSCFVPKTPTAPDSFWRLKDGSHTG